MTKEPEKPTPQETLRSGIKAAVAATNTTLASLQQVSDKVQKPVVSVLQTVEDTAATASAHAAAAYQRRHEFAPHLVGGSALLGGGIMALRRGRIAGVLGAAVAGGAAYAVAYDEITFSKLPDVKDIVSGNFGKRE